MMFYVLQPSSIHDNSHGSTNIDKLLQMESPHFPLPNQKQKNGSQQENVSIKLIISRTFKPASASFHIACFMREIGKLMNNNHLNEPSNNPYYDELNYKILCCTMYLLKAYTNIEYISYFTEVIKGPRLVLFYTYIIIN